MSHRFIFFIAFSFLGISCNNHFPENKVAKRNDTLAIMPNPAVASADSQSKTLESVNRNKPKKELLEIITKIIKTSPEFLKLTKGLKKAIIENGGSGRSLEYLPIPSEQGQMGLYYFGLYEVYDNRTPRISSYCFDMNKKQLFKEQILDTDSLATGNLKPMKFDKKLLPDLYNLLGASE